MKNKNNNQVDNLEDLFNEAQQICDELNNLDFRKPDEDKVFMKNLNRMSEIHGELSGVPNVNKSRTKTYLQ